jgi:ribosomal protein S12 methylthiotransferase accessory factor
MEIKVLLKENQKLEAHFDGFTVFSDQPLSNKGDNTAPSPFDYFLASTAMCAGYFIKAYCQPRGIPTDEIQITQINTKDPEVKYKQHINIIVKVPESISEKDRLGIMRSIEGCSVKKAIQQVPEIKIEVNS